MDCVVGNANTLRQGKLKRDCKYHKTTRSDNRQAAPPPPYILVSPKRLEATFAIYVRFKRRNAMTVLPNLPLSFKLLIFHALPLLIVHYMTLYRF